MPRRLRVMMGLGLAFLSAGAPGADDAVPADPDPRWWKGNLHTHTLWSDGNDFPEMVAEWYRTNGYNFLALSDHNVLSQGERWMDIGEIDRRSRGSAFEPYLARFGPSWVETRGSRAAGDLEVRLKPLEEVRPLVEQRGSFLMIQSEEISDGFQGKPIHINATNIGEVIKPQGGGSVADTIRNNLLAVIEQSERLGRPIIPHLNHPNFGWAVTAEDIAEVVEERFFEVYNGHTGVRNAGDARHASTERIWDIANTLRIGALGAAPLYGIATDDSHSYHGHSPVSITGRGWVRVRATHLTPESLIDAMERGDFYASSGVVLDDVRFEPESGRLSIQIEPAPGATYVTRFIGTRRGYDDGSEPVRDQDGTPLGVTRSYSGDVGAVLAEVQGLRPSYVLTGDELYVRAVVESSLPPERPTKEMLLRKAWTQPVGWRRWLDADAD